MYNDRFGELEQVFVPFTTSRDLEMDRSGSMDCWDDDKDSDDPEGETGVNAPCTWIQYWVAARHAGAGRGLSPVPGQLLRPAARQRPLPAPDQRAPARRDGMAGFQQGRAGRRAAAAVAGVRLPAGLPAQHGRPAAGEVPAAQQRDRRAPRARRVAARDLRAMPRRGRRGRPGRRRARARARVARPVGRPPATQQLQLAGAPGLCRCSSRRS